MSQSDPHIAENRGTYPGRRALPTKPPSPTWIPLYFEGLSGPGWRGWQLDLGLAEQLQERGEFSSIDEGRAVLWDLRQSFIQARDEHAASLEVDALADDEDLDQLPLPLFGHTHSGRGRHDHPPPPLEDLLRAVRPCGTLRRAKFKDGEPNKSDREVAERLSFVYKHRGRGLSDLDFAYQAEWTEARALTKAFFLTRNPRANHQPSVAPSIARKLPPGELVEKIVGWLIYADQCRKTGITCPAPVWTRILDCSVGGWWGAWRTVERYGFGISMRRYRPGPREESGDAYGSPVSLDDNWYGVGPKLAELRSIYLPPAQLELDLRAEALRTGVSLADLRAQVEQRRQVERDKALLAGRKHQARIRRQHHHHRARQRGEVVRPRGAKFLSLKEFVYATADNEARLAPLRAHLEELQAERTDALVSFWAGGCRGDEPGFEGWPPFWSLAESHAVAIPVLHDAPTTAATAALAICRHLPLPETRAWLAQIPEIARDSSLINAVNWADGTPTPLLGCEIKEERARYGLTAAGALLGSILSPSGTPEPRGPVRGLQDKAAGDGREPRSGPATAPTSTASPPRSTDPPATAPTSTASPPRSTDPPATAPTSTVSPRLAAAQEIARSLSRMENSNLRNELAAIFGVKPEAKIVE